MPHSNPQRDKAINFHLTNSISTTNIKKNLKGKERQPNFEKDLYSFAKKSSKYKVELSSPYFHGPSEIFVNHNNQICKENQNFPDQTYSEIPIRFTPELPGKYTCKVIVSCTEFCDIRVFTVYGTAISEGSWAELDFCCAVRQTVTQDIPVINKTQDDWTIKAIIEGNGFIGPYLITVKSLSVTNYPIIFRPQKDQIYHSKLILSNLQTAQKHVYILRGVGESPLPEETINVECTARQPV
ncbi:Cilia- and flagella-associated protein 47 [Nowakowskiella sp. JEL0078]|nr:Cilia- and flagella-associated protein 47 [Nowakowskiella sp. JEL0078]